MADTRSPLMGKANPPQGTTPYPRPQGRRGSPTACRGHGAWGVGRSGPVRFCPSASAAGPTAQHGHQGTWASQPSPGRAVLSRPRTAPSPRGTAPASPHAGGSSIQGSLSSRSPQQGAGSREHAS